MNIHSEFYVNPKFTLETIADYLLILSLIFTGPIIIYCCFHFFTIEQRITYRIWVPRRLEEFSLTTYSSSFCDSSISKMNSFIDSLGNNLSCTISLNEDELNSLILKSKTYDKYIPGRYVYYKVDENSIIESFLSWPNFSSPDACLTSKKKLNFKTKHELKTIEIKELEHNGFTNFDSYSFEATKSVLLLIVFNGLSYIPSFDTNISTYYGQEEDVENARSLVEKLSEIKIINNSLVLSFNSII